MTKRILAGLVMLMLCLCARGQSGMVIPLQNYMQQAVTNRLVNVDYGTFPNNVPPGGLVISDTYQFTSDSNGNVWITNAVAGYYSARVLPPPSLTVLRFWVPTNITNGGFVSATNFPIGGFNFYGSSFLALNSNSVIIGPPQSLNGQFASANGLALGSGVTNVPTLTSSNGSVTIHTNGSPLTNWDLSAAGGGGGSSSNTYLVFNVTNYGAVGNNSTDCSAAVSNAIAACVALITNGSQTYQGGVVYFPAGVYKMSNWQILPTYGGTATNIATQSGPIILRGDVQGASILNFAIPNSNVNSNGGGCITALGTGFLEIDHLNFQGTNAIPYVYVTGTTVYVHDCYFMTDAAQSWSAILAGTNSNNNLAGTNCGFGGYLSHWKDNKFDGAGGALLGGADLNGLIWTGNLVHGGTAVAAVDLTDSHYCSLTGTTIEMLNFNYGFVIGTGCQGCYIAGNGMDDLNTNIVLGGILYESNGGFAAFGNFDIGNSLGGYPNYNVVADQTGGRNVSLEENNNASGWFQDMIFGANSMLSGSNMTLTGFLSTPYVIVSNGMANVALPNLSMRDAAPMHTDAVNVLGHTIVNSNQLAFNWGIFSNSNVPLYTNSAIASNANCSPGQFQGFAYDAVSSNCYVFWNGNTAMEVSNYPNPYLISGSFKYLQSNTFTIPGTNAGATSVGVSCKIVGTNLACLLPSDITPATGQPVFQGFATLVMLNTNGLGIDHYVYLTNPVIGGVTRSNLFNCLAPVANAVMLNGKWVTNILVLGVQLVPDNTNLLSPGNYPFWDTLVAYQVSTNASWQYLGVVPVDKYQIAAGQSLAFNANDGFLYFGGYDALNSASPDLSTAYFLTGYKVSFSGRVTPVFAGYQPCQDWDFVYSIGQYALGAAGYGNGSNTVAVYDLSGKYAVMTSQNGTMQVYGNYGGSILVDSYDDNVLVGFGALGSAGFDDPVENTAIGQNALAGLTGNNQNTAVGFEALSSDVNSGGNTAVGTAALQNTIGSDNIGLGLSGGASITSGANNIDIGNTGTSTDARQIRLGTVGTHTNAVIAGDLSTGSNVTAGLALIAPKITLNADNLYGITWTPGGSTINENADVLSLEGGAGLALSGNGSGVAIGDYCTMSYALTLAGKLTNTLLTASEPVVTDANKALASVTYATFSGNLTGLTPSQFANIGANTVLGNASGSAAAVAATGNPSITNLTVSGTITGTSNSGASLGSTTNGLALTPYNGVVSLTSNLVVGNNETVSNTTTWVGTSTSNQMTGAALTFLDNLTGASSPNATVCLSNNLGTNWVESRVHAYVTSTGTGSSITVYAFSNNWAWATNAGTNIIAFLTDISISSTSTTNSTNIWVVTCPGAYFYNLAGVAGGLAAGTAVVTGTHNTPSTTLIYTGGSTGYGLGLTMTNATTVTTKIFFTATERQYY